MLELLSLFGITTGQFIFGATAIGGSIAAKIAVDMDTVKKEREDKAVTKAYDEMIKKKRKIEVSLFNEEKQKVNEEIKKNYEQMQVDRKERELKEYKLIEDTCETKYPYKGIKPNSMDELLIGHDVNGEPIWGKATNYIVAGTTGAGKTRKMYPIVLNYLAAQQGTLYIGDLKGTDFFMFKNKKNVAKYVSDLENAPEVIKAFESEYESRKALFNQGGYINLDDYNKRSESKLRLFMLVIDEYADIADIFHDRIGRPLGCYADLVRLARKVRSFGGRIILGTQRPDVTVICGQLKNNCAVIGLQCVNTISSNVMIGNEGCERLIPTEALTVINGKLVKVFSYNITDEKLNECISKLR